MEPKCTVCGKPLDPERFELGLNYHIGCKKEPPPPIAFQDDSELSGWSQKDGAGSITIIGL